MLLFNIILVLQDNLETTHWDKELLNTRTLFPLLDFSEFSEFLTSFITRFLFVYSPYWYFIK